MIDIYNGYTTNEVLLDEPYIDKDLKLYPIKINKYKEFNKYLHYILYSKKHYGIKDNKIKLLNYVIALNVSNYRQQIQDKTDMELTEMVLKDLERLFSIICREDISIDLSQAENEVVFTNQDKTIQINNKNFNKIRIIALKQNAILEPKIFEDKMEEKLAEKWLKSKQLRNKNSVSGIGEMANVISCVTGKYYSELYNQNILQFYADYYRCTHIENYKATTLFRTVSNDITIIDFTNEVISDLYRDPYEGMWQDFDNFVGGLN